MGSYQHFELCPRVTLNACSHLRHSSADVRASSNTRLVGKGPWHMPSYWHCTVDVQAHTQLRPKKVLAEMPCMQTCMQTFTWAQPLGHVTSNSLVVCSLIQQQQPSTSYVQDSAQHASNGMYPSLPQQAAQPAQSQLQQLLQRLCSPSMQVPAYRSGSSYSLWQLAGLVKDPEVHPQVMQAGILPTLVALLLDNSLDECQVHTATVLQRLAVRSPPNCEAVCKAGAVSALVQMLPASKAAVRVAAARCLCLLGWNSNKVKSEIIFTLCKSSKESSGQISCIEPLLPFFTHASAAEVEAASACLHMLSAAAAPDVLATFELHQTSLAQHLCRALDSGTPPTAFAAAEALKAIAQLPANKAEVVQQQLLLMQSGCPPGQADAANLCWELCCANTTTHNPSMTAAVSTLPDLIPALTSTLNSTDPSVVRSALGLVHVLALEASKAQNTYACPVNVDTVRLHLVAQTPALQAIERLLQSPGGMALLCWLHSFVASKHQTTLHDIAECMPSCLHFNDWLKGCCSKDVQYENMS